MRRCFSATGIPVLAVAGGLLLGGCGGGGTKTVSVASAPPVAQTGATTAPPTHTSSTATTPATTPASTAPAPSGTPSGGTSGPTTTRTATAPAFTHETTTAEGLSAAEAVLRERGFTASSTAEYHPNQTLRVLIGTRAGSSEGNGQQAFFFVDERYLGTDAKQPSASIEVVSQGDTEVTLAYALSGGGRANVRFQLDNGQLTPLEPIPSAASRQ